MSFVRVGQENSEDILIHYEDHGSGRPVVLIHGYPSNGRSWEKQERALLGAGRRVVTYDRRGFGRSSQPSVGYDYDTFAGDLRTLIHHLELVDVDLVGFSMGTGEVVRYLAAYGSERVRRAVLIGAVSPHLTRGDDNPAGIPESVFDEIKAAIVDDRPGYLKTFLDMAYNINVYAGSRVSDEAWHNSFNAALASSPWAATACVDAVRTDFRDDLRRVDVPVLLVHGDADRILPYEATAARLSGLLADLRTVIVEGGPHHVLWTHPEVVNPALLDFLAE